MRYGYAHDIFIIRNFRNGAAHAVEAARLRKSISEEMNADTEGRQMVGCVK